jgi:polyhydroxyalkanoate synthase subunit PhaC
MSFLKNIGGIPLGSTISDPLASALGASFSHMVQACSALSMPLDAISKVQTQYVQEATELWNQNVNAPQSGTWAGAGLFDKRFAAQEWFEQPSAHFNAQLYLLNTRTLMSMADLVQGDEKIRQRLKFSLLQATAAACPANCLVLNPEVIQKIITSQGESLRQGMAHLWHDLQKGVVSQTNETAFQLGGNIATTAGSVVFENAFFQLIEYQPLGAKVFEKPLLMVPPCINKYYILDLQPHNSLIRFAVEQGHRVFAISWVNPDASLAQATWDDYVQHGVIQALDVVRAIVGSVQINALGFCIGGTLLTTAMAVMAAQNKSPVASLTLLTTLLDFSHTGVLDIFVDEALVQWREMTLGAASKQAGGLLQGQELSRTFSALRPNELVWNYVIGNYLKGQTPAAFDMLYWNADVTHLPGPMYCWYLRHTYLENKLVQPGGVQVCGQAIDLGLIDVPVYIYGSREDHIVPWQSAYASLKALKGCQRQARFVLGASGHIAGVINPPQPVKRSHWVGAKTRLPAAADTWFESAQEYPGSWWPDWQAWLATQAGALKRAPQKQGSRAHPVIEAAPGRYVLRKI